RRAQQPNSRKLRSSGSNQTMSRPTKSGAGSFAHISGSTSLSPGLQQKRAFDREFSFPACERGANMSSDSRNEWMLKIFAGLMVAHWLEHLVQAYQVWGLGYERHHAGGLLGQVFPWLMHSEWLHFAYAVLTFAGLLVLYRAFEDPALRWWKAALVIQA